MNIVVKTSLMKRIFFIILLNIIFFNYAFAETFKLKKHHIGISSGLSFYKVKDEIASPMAYNGSGIPIQLSYRYRGIKNRHNICLSYTKSKLSPSTSFSYGQHNIEHYHINLKYGYHRFFTSLLKNKVKLFLGGIWNTNASLRKHLYDRNQSEPFGDVVSSLDLSFLSEFKMGEKNRIIDEISIPIIAFVLRPGYSGKFPLTTDLTSIHRFIRFKNQLSYERSLSPFFNIRFKYNFIYYQYPNPQKIKLGMDHFSIEILYKFGGK